MKRYTTIEEEDARKNVATEKGIYVIGSLPSPEKSLNEDAAFLRERVQDFQERIIASYDMHPEEARRLLNEFALLVLDISNHSEVAWLFRNIIEIWFSQQSETVAGAWLAHEGVAAVRKSSPSGGFMPHMPLLQLCAMLARTAGVALDRAAAGHDTERISRNSNS